MIRPASRAIDTGNNVLIFIPFSYLFKDKPQYTPVRRKAQCAYVTYFFQIFRIFSYILTIYIFLLFVTFTLLNLVLFMLHKLNKFLLFSIS
jgi:hypothetical protein